jgi:threonine aldolase
MRQVGILAAAGLYALDHHLDRLAEDHEHAKLIASRLRSSPHVSLVADPVETNIVIFSLAAEAPTRLRWWLRRARAVCSSWRSVRGLSAPSHTSMSRRMSASAPHPCLWRRSAP